MDEPDTGPDSREKLMEEWRVQDDRIQAAYWAFCHQKRAKPPIMVVPDAYKKRHALEQRMKESSSG